MVARKPRIVKMTWDVAPTSTEELLDDLGVSKLDDTDDEEYIPTPPVHIPPLMPPGVRDFMFDLNFIFELYTCNKFYKVYKC